MDNLKSNKGDSLRSAVFKTPDGSKIIAEKNKTYTGNVDGVELTVDYKVAAKLRKLLSQDYVYDPQLACNHILSVEEVYAQMEEQDPNHHSDWADYITPELDTDKMKQLSQEELLDRYAAFIDICNQTAQDSILQKVLEVAPKKKNKTFAKNRVTVIAAFQAVSGELGFCELIAKATSDTGLTLTLMERGFSEEEWSKSLNSPFNEIISLSEEEKEKAESAISYATFSCDIPSYGKKKNLSMRFPVVKLENGEFALKASSKRALSDFICLKGDVKSGYQIVMPEKFETFSYTFEEETFDVECSFERDGYNHWNYSIYIDLGYLEAALRYARTGKTRPAHDHLDVFLSGLGREGEKLKVFTEAYVTDLFYQLLCSTDMVCEAFQTQEGIEEIIKKAVENNGGKMINGARYGKVRMISPYVGDELELIVRLDLHKQKGKDMWIEATSIGISVA